MRPFGPVPGPCARSTPSSRASGGPRDSRATAEKPGVARTAAAAGGAPIALGSAVAAATSSPAPRWAAAGAGAGASARRCRRRCGRAVLSVGAVRLDVGDQVALRHAAAAFDLDLADDAGRGGRHVHRRLLGLERDQRRSTATVSPACTSDSMTSTSLKSPMSGTRTSMSCGHRRAPPRPSPGSGLSGSIPNRSIASSPSRDRACPRRPAP